MRGATCCYWSPLCLWRTQTKTAASSATISPSPGQETPGTGVGADSDQVTLLDADGSVEELPLMLKYDVAVHLLDRIRDLLAARDARLGERPARILS